MPRFERDHAKHNQGDAKPNASAYFRSNADADESAAHIAELVRRTAERNAAPTPSCVAPAEVPVAQPTPKAAPSVARPVAKPVKRPAAKPAWPKTGQPSRRILVAAGAAVAVLIGVGVTLSHPFSPGAGTAAGTGTTPERSTPAGYAVKVTDVITDCASHARGRTRSSFETQNCMKATRSLATGQVSGRSVLFVVSRIQMASAEEAASVKQVLDGSGTGNLNDLLREGRTFPGAPDKMPDSGYVSVQSGKVVSVAEVGFVDGGHSSSSDASLRAAAAQVASLAGTG